MPADYLNQVFFILGIIFVVIIGFFFLLLIFDVFIQKSYAIVHNIPILGHLRHLLTLIGPELRQYWVANDKEELPFNRSERDWIYASAKGENNTFGFGTSELLYGVGYPIIKHSGFPFPNSKSYFPFGDKTSIPCAKLVGGYHKRKRPYRPKSIINISGMSFGSLGKNAISALNKGALMAGSYHNTGEGAISEYHKCGADLMWQIGTGYFGCRDDDGHFSLDILAEKCKVNPVRMIEIKLSQGAKPGKGGILPGPKVTKEISEVRGIPEKKDCLSPNTHSEFEDIDGLIDFIERIADKTGLPVGIKAAIGQIGFWEDLAKRMKERNEGPDFITIDGGEGGTGAAPLTFSDHVSLPFKIGFARVYEIFQEVGLSKYIVWIGSGKLGFPDRTIIAMTMGCDIIHIAREAMLAIGCIQAQKCHTGHCPVGVATQNKWLQAGLDVEIKAERFKKYVQSFRKELLDISHAAGYEHPCQFKAKDVEFSTGVNKFSTLDDVLKYTKEDSPFVSMRELEKKFKKKKKA